jgi:hypothetical protein
MMGLEVRIRGLRRASPCDPSRAQLGSFPMVGSRLPGTACPRIPDDIRERIVRLAQDKLGVVAPQLAVRFTDSDM